METIDNQAFVVLVKTLQDRGMIKTQAELAEIIGEHGSQDRALLGPH